MTGKDYRDYLQDILDSIIETDDFVRGMLFEDFLLDNKTGYPLCQTFD